MFLDKLKNQLNESQPLFIGEETAFRSAVLIPLVQVVEEWHILFEVRSFTMRKQPGDISFPGGRIDPSDSTPLAAALRETQEELGVDPKTVTNVRELSPYIASPLHLLSIHLWQLLITIKLFILITKKRLKRYLQYRVRWLLNYEPYMHLVSVEPTPSPDFPFEKIVNGAQYQWRTHSIEEWFFDYEKYTIWGLTARILKHFIEIIK